MMDQATYADGSGTVSHGTSGRSMWVSLAKAITELASTNEAMSKFFIFLNSWVKENEH